MKAMTEPMPQPAKNGTTHPTTGPMADPTKDLQALAQALRSRGWRLATAESCTGGLIAAACTSLAGSSDWFDRGFVTYSNEAKSQMLGVDPALIARHGAVSREVACAMAEGALQHSPADLAVAVTGIAGPGGAVPGKPVGTVWLALAVKGAQTTPETPAEHAAWRLQCTGDRAAVRQATVQQAIRQLLQRAALPPNVQA
jgi:nicotinamide-nucleotide amidase